MADETINTINRLLSVVEEKLGYGESLGKAILEQAPNADFSL